MDKDIVLAKIYSVNELLRNQKEKIVDLDNKLKINHTGKVLICSLLKNDGINQRNLASLLSISPQAISECIKKLEILALIEKKHGTQKNENLIFLTSTGRDFALKLREKIVVHADKVFSKFTDDELLQLYNLLNKIR